MVINITATLHYTGTVLQVHAGSAKAAIGKKTVLEPQACNLVIQKQVGWCLAHGYFWLLVYTKSDVT